MTRTAERKPLEFEYEDGIEFPTHLWSNGIRYRLRHFNAEWNYRATDHHQVLFMLDTFEDPLPPPPKPRTARSLGLRRPT